MYDEYFSELDPVKRKKILDGLEPEPGDEEALEQIRSLFEERYTPNKKGGFNDRFIGALVTLRSLAENPRGKWAAKEDTRKVSEAVHTLCLDREGAFSTRVLYNEMRQLLLLYVDTCREDGHYQSVIFGMGRLSKEKVTAKIKLDMHYFWDPIVKFLGDEGAYYPLKNAIDSVLEEKLPD